MDAAIRWSTHREGASRFLIADTAGSRLRYCELIGTKDSKVEFEQISQLDRLSDFTTFDWSRNDETIIAIGTTQGESCIVNLNPLSSLPGVAQSYPIKQQRECTSIAFSGKDLLATALKRHRTDFSLNVYDLRDPSGGVEPFQKLASGDAVANVKFFEDQADCLLAGVSGKGLRLYDLRGEWGTHDGARQVHSSLCTIFVDSNTAGAASVSTRQCHLMSIDPLDQNYFASAGPPGDNIVSIWDRRAIGRTALGVSVDAILEIKDVIDTHRHTNVRTLRFSGSKRGSFAVISSAGQLRLFDIARHPSTPDYGMTRTESINQDPDGTLHYLRKSQDLQYARFDRRSSQDDMSRAVAFDFTTPSNLIDAKSTIVSLCRNGDVKMVPILPPPAFVQLTPLNDIAIHEQRSYAIASALRAKTIAEELLDIQTKVRTHTIRANSARSKPESVELESLAKQAPTIGRLRIYEAHAKLSSRERHEELLSMGLPTVSLNLADTLTVMNTQRRRCQEGYLFNCERNKEVVKNDPWLMALWAIVNRLEHMADADGMTHDALDFSYIGVNDLWWLDVEQAHDRGPRHRSVSEEEIKAAIRNIVSEHEYGDFEGPQTNYGDRRQLGLAICGWRFSEERLRAKCTEILSRGEHYQAILMAFYHGDKTVAIDMLKTAIRSGSIENSGLAAVIACDRVSKEQSSLCAWMAEDAQDPYLKALLTYFVTGEWKSIADMTTLPLVYRVAVALKYLDDSTLGRFLKTATTDAIQHGDTEGIILTGLGKDVMSLFQNYIDKSNDLQTAVLVTAFGSYRYIDDARWQLWKETYFSNMQAWKAFMERTRFTVQHSRKAVDRNGQKLISAPPRQVTLRCNHCQKSIAKPEDAKALGENGSTIPSKAPTQPTHPQNPSSAAGTVCPRCGRHLPRCSICMLWLGTPASISTPARGAAGGVEDAMAKFINFCMACGHGFHANHAREWFRKHQVCPVPNCQCLCAQRR